MSRRPAAVQHDTAPAAGYPDRRTGATLRQRLIAGWARVRMAAAPPLLHPTGSGAATAAARAHEEPVTDADLAAAADPNVPTRVIGGRLCTNRAGLAHLAGWKPGGSVHVRAGTDPDFPEGVKHGREYWYPFDGHRGVDAYLALLAERAENKKPPPVKPGDPDDLLPVEEAADALHIRAATLRSYVRWSIPYWTGEKTGRPLVPPPDVEEEREHQRLGPYIHRAWYRRTLTAHQRLRPGPGTGAGRPRAATTTQPRPARASADAGHNSPGETRR